jgi:hypothetical protein
VQIAALAASQDGELGAAGPAYYFLPFYIDQDEGSKKSGVPWQAADFEEKAGSSSRKIRHSRH